MLHYVWATHEVFGECFEYGICLLWYGKKITIEYLPFLVSGKRLELWIESAKQVWARMEAVENGESVPHEVATHATKYGPCVYSKACLDYYREPSLMKKDYMIIER
jgi:hypothetical protein